MNEHRTMLLEMVEKLFSDLAERNGADSRSDAGFSRDWHAIEELGLTRLMLPETAGGFDGNWEDAGPVFKALGSHGITLPLAENILARHWLHRLGVESPEEIIRIASTPSEPTDEVVLRTMQWANQTQWVMMLGPETWSLQPTETVADNPVGRGSADRHVRLRGNKPAALAEGLLSKDHQSFFAEAALMRACQIAGAVETMLHMTIRHAQDRSQFGRPLGRFQTIQHQLAILAEENAAASCAAASACQAAVAGDACFEMGAAKYRASRAATTAADIAHQIHGAIGFTQEFSLHRFSLPAQAWAREFGNEEHWAQWLGRFTLDARPEPLWHWLTARSDRVIADEKGRPS